MPPCRLRLALLLPLALAGCAAPAPRDPDAVERRLRLSARVADDPAGERRVRGVACALDASWCATLRVFVLRTDVPLADYRPGGVLRVSAGLLRRAADVAALAFALAHERAHETLGHYAGAGERRGAAREIAADAAARAALDAAGVDPRPGVALLERIRDEARRNPSADRAGLEALDARLEALLRDAN